MIYCIPGRGLVIAKIFVILYISRNKDMTLASHARHACRSDQFRT